MKLLVVAGYADYFHPGLIRTPFMRRSLEQALARPVVLPRADWIAPANDRRYHEFLLDERWEDKAGLFGAYVRDNCRDEHAATLLIPALVVRPLHGRFAAPGAEEVTHRAGRVLSTLARAADAESVELTILTPGDDPTEADAAPLLEPLRAAIAAAPAGYDRFVLVRGEPLSLADTEAAAHMERNVVGSRLKARAEHAAEAAGLALNSDVFLTAFTAWLKGLGVEVRVGTPDHVVHALISSFLSLGPAAR